MRLRSGFIKTIEEKKKKKKIDDIKRKYVVSRKKSNEKKKNQQANTSVYHSFVHESNEIESNEIETQKTKSQRTEIKNIETEKKLNENNSIVCTSESHDSDVDPRGMNGNNNNTQDQGIYDTARALSPNTTAAALQAPLPEFDDDEHTVVRERQQQQQRDSNFNRTHTIRTHKKMTELVARPEKLCTTGNLAENWKNFRRDLDIYMVATESSEKSAKIKVAIFLNLIGRDALKLFDTFNLTAAQKENYDAVLQSFEDFCKPKKNVVFERFMFISRSQKEGESFDAFLMDIKQLASSCEFNAMESEMLRDRIVHGVANKRIQTKLLEMSDLTYDKAVEKCRADEVTQEQTINMSKTTASVNEVKQNQMKSAQTQGNGRYNNNNNSYRGNRNAYNGNSRNYGNNTNQNNGNKNKNDNKNSRSLNFRQQNNTNNSNRFNSSINCKFCNLRHEHNKMKCPAYGKNCRACSRPNHFESVCKSRNVNAINSSDFDNNNDDFYAHSLTQVHSVSNGKKPVWKEHLTINNKVVAFKVDTGSDVATLPKRLLDVIAPNIPLQPTTKILRAFGGSVVKPIGVCRLKCVHRNRYGKFIEKIVEFDVVDVESVPLLGLIEAVRLGWIDIRRIGDYRTQQELKHFL